MKKGIVIGIISVFILLLGILAYLTTSQNILSSGGIGDLPEQTKNINWNGYQVNLTSPFFGSLVSGKKYEDTKYGDYVICGDNDGRIGISNLYIENTPFQLSSSTYGVSKSCGGNFITWEATLPSGNLTLNYELSATATYGDSGTSYTTIIINKNTLSSISCMDTGNSGDCGSPTRTTQTREKSGNYVLELKEQTDVLIELRTGKSSYGNSNAKASLTFTPTQIVQKTTQEVIKEITEKVGNNHTPEEINEVIAQVEITNNVKLTQEQKDFITKTILDNQSKFNPFYILYGIIGIFIIVLIFLVVKMRKK